jgi:uncharacterized membrane protein YeaQ/YmgE (transglycosylase-associated protein family)
LKCAAAIHACFALASFVGLLLVAGVAGNVASNLGPRHFVAGFVVTVALAVVSVGLCRRHRWARWTFVATSFVIATSHPVIGTALIMYLIRPELDRQFM